MSATSVPWVDGLTIAQVLAQTARHYPERDAVVFPQLAYRLDYSQFLTEVRRAARALLAVGVEPGEHVAIWATNQPPWVILQFAVAAVGAVLVNVNPAYRGHELRYVLEQADVTTLFLADRFKTSDYFAMLDTVLLELRQAGTLKLRRIVSITATARPDMPSWTAFLDRAAEVSDATLDARLAAVRPDDTANIQYTSGTTGFPKGAMLTHRNLLLNGFYVGDRQRLTPQDRMALPVPLYHCFGCVMGTLACAAHGSAMVFPAESFDALATLEAIQAGRCTSLYGVPTMFIAQLNHPRFASFDLSSLRTGVMAGSPCPIELMKAVIERMHASTRTR